MVHLLSQPLFEEALGTLKGALPFRDEEIGPASRRSFARSAEENMSID